MAPTGSSSKAAKFDLAGKTAKVPQKCQQYKVSPQLEWVAHFQAGFAILCFFFFFCLSPLSITINQVKPAGQNTRLVRRGSGAGKKGCWLAGPLPPALARPDGGKYTGKYIRMFLYLKNDCSSGAGQFDENLERRPKIYQVGVELEPI